LEAYIYASQFGSIYCVRGRGRGHHDFDSGVRGGVGGCAARIVSIAVSSAELAAAVNTPQQSMCRYSSREEILALLVKQLSASSCRGFQRNGTVVPEGGMHSANVRDAKYVHSLGSVYSRGVSLLSAGRASCSRRPPASLSISDVRLAEVVCFVGAAAMDRVSTWAANCCTIFVSNCTLYGCYSGASRGARG
jgi:hypothetical protein